MLKEIELRDVATYDAVGQKLENLTPVNFIYGANGSGKTTISRVVNSPDSFDNCSVLWTGSKLQLNTYNQDFIEQNFHQTGDLKGIFTLGEESKQLVEDIENAKKEVDNLRKDIDQLTNTLDGHDDQLGKRTEKSELEKQFDEDMWAFKKKYQDTFKEALKGTLGKKPDFSARIRKAHTSQHTTKETTIELAERYTSLFDKNLDKAPLLPFFSVDHITKLINNEILQKVIVGKEDVSVSDLIKRLSNSDWVREGMQFLEHSNDLCPFCQQKQPHNLNDELNAYFDEAYTSDIKAVRILLDKYKTEWESIKDTVQEIEQTQTDFVDQQKLSNQFELLQQKHEANLKSISRKIEEPTHKCNLNDLSPLLQEILDLILTANDRIRVHNQLVDNKSSEKEKLKDDIWAYIATDAAEHINIFQQKITAVEKAIESIEKSIENKGSTLDKKNIVLNNLEKKGTSIQGSVMAINQILNDFGFKGFKLAVSESTGYYRIVRPNGSDAKTSLSEGEKTFITFLYFVHLLRGSITQDNVTSNRIAVIDDPVSSLDSEVLFIVSTLIKGIISSIFDEYSPIKQVILLTHNMYFFKEVAFSSTHARKGKKPKTESYWLVTKRDEVSTIERHSESPVKSAYQMLWDEIKRPNNSKHTIRNTIRRILEYYFTTIGNQQLNDLPDFFDGSEKHVCRSLISWIHEGSHFTDDDYTVVPSIETVERQLNVFQRIFEVTNHLSHYEMMMGITLVEQTEEPADQSQN
ncbi:AAA family ATPase [Thalassospira sp. GB04J01]|uniref:AAA family ATPase n=1 Tax=Thalassospira sp. GB04J01 TaxID=1485225 RepID=UPI000C9CAD14|nr:AAA family ATPase [Thalassospira sp. GB04J01]|tara:strand:+ start:42486 stop:44729 length:2244 start_codon:yes stop_codon:yes gene_type:complete